MPAHQAGIRGAADAKRDWVLMRELDRLARSVAGARRDWVRANLLAAPPPWIDIFIARNFHYLTELHCPASMSIAAELLGVDAPAMRTWRQWPTPTRARSS